MPNANVSNEIKDIILADVVLILAFSLAFNGGIFNSGSPHFASSVILILPIVALGITLSFVLHELMHKFVAQHYGAIAGFRASYTGLLITFATGMFGFLFGIPGATIIYAHSFTKRQNGIVSLAGPLTNFVVFAVFYAILMLVNPYTTSYAYEAITFVMFISILLAFFNMLPIFPLDGSKVLQWSVPVYVVTMAVIFVLLYLTKAISIWEILFLLVIAIMFSFLYRSAIRF